jgi:3-methyladenine DNA glycosylase/8-oxoguanine DNA glycosylase
VTRQRLSLRIEPPFALDVVVFGHGWIDLAPNVWDAPRRVLRTAARIDSIPTDLTVRQTDRRLHVTASAARRLAPDAVRSVIKRMLRLAEDFGAWWSLCRNDRRLEWAAQLGAGRLMRAPTVFEDLAKLLLTTNCSWTATRRMVNGLVGQLGEQTPGGARTFPSAERCAEMPERFFREVVRAGYRAGPLRDLARRAAAGELDRCDEPTVSGEPLREFLLTLKGFGPYAAGQALRLLGHYEDLALDSWCRAQLRAQTPNGRDPSERSIARRYAGFGRYRGLALWVDLTRSWHLEPRATTPLATTPQ